MKEKILKYIRHKPLLRKILSKIYLQYIKINNFFRKKEFKEIYYIDPKNVKKESWKYFNIFKKEWKIKDWDWDITWTNWNENLIYKWLKERFIDKKNWEETSYFKIFYKKIKDWKLMWNCWNKKEFLLRCKNLDSIYKDIKENWYKLNTDSITWWYDEVTINIWRKWDLLFNDWAHRLSIAKILKLEKIPVRIIARHKNWYLLIKYLRSVLPNQVSYQSLWHVDLDTNFIIDHPCYNRFKLIKDYLPKPNKKSKSLDIWWNIGFFTKELEKLWFNAYIIEHESFYINILKKIKKILGFNYNIIDEDMFEWKWINNNKFDVVIALNIFHHFIKTKKFHKKLVKLINNLDMDVMIFESHNTNESQMKWAYKNYSPKEFVEFIIKESKLNKYEKIWKLKDNWRREREIFKIYK